MKFKSLAARFALVVSCGLMTATAANAQFWQCAPYAREISGIKIHGNANTWWGQAAGRYERGNAPKVGAVLSFQPTRRMRVGHVAMVSQVVSDREVRLTHANWSRRGQIERDVRAIDVSPAGDWSMVKVWYAPNGGLGTSDYPTNGFIYADGNAGAPMIRGGEGEGSDETRLANLAIASAASVPVSGGISVTQ
ncbi:CHAP domain-containing protein [Sphingomonas sp.]|jgi:surface antigen|uniref:CHAP domain-containing protein n=1 Tax=Sphingomonas sp. TaxID=28214 RepID=UPI002636445D|nr:CHAP domain-containing protein [Sphingomonas sp.]MDF2494076.1 chap [Sphingomonas sp.]